MIFRIREEDGRDIEKDPSKDEPHEYTVSPSPYWGLLVRIMGGLFSASLVKEFHRKKNSSCIHGFNYSIRSMKCQVLQ